MVQATDGITWSASAHVDKWTPQQVRLLRRRGLPDLTAPCAADFAAAGIPPAEQVDAPGNLVTTAGLTRIVSLAAASGGQALTGTACRLGLGNGSAAATAADTDLAAAAGTANRWFQVMDAGWPQVAASLIQFKATFGANDGNFSWTEWGIDVGTPTVTSGATVNPLLLNHKSGVSLGVKGSGQVWSLTVGIQFS